MKLLVLLVLGMSLGCASLESADQSLLNLPAMSVAEPISRSAPYSNLFGSSSQTAGACSSCAK